MRAKILGLYESNKSIRDISKQLKIPKSTIQDTISHYKNSGSVKTGRPRILNGSDQKELKKIVKENNCSSINMIQKKYVETSNVEVSSSTIRRNLHELKIFSRKTAPDRKAVRKSIEMVSTKKKLECYLMGKSHME